VTRSQMLAASQRGNDRLAQIDAGLSAAQGISVLAPFAAAESALQVWKGLDLARKRAVIQALATITILPAGRGARTFDPATVEVVPVQPRC